MSTTRAASVGLGGGEQTACGGVGRTFAKFKLCDMRRELRKCPARPHAQTDRQTDGRTRPTDRGQLDQSVSDSTHYCLLH